MGDRRVCNGEYKCELSGANKLLVPDHTDRRVESGSSSATRDLCGSPSPAPLLKQGHLEQAAQNLVQVGLEYLQRRRLHSLPRQPVPVLCHPQSEDVLPHVRQNFLCFSLCPLPLVLSLGTTEKSLALSS